MHSLQVVTVDQKDTVTAAAEYLIEQLIEQNFFTQPAALFLSGGSNIQVAHKMVGMIDKKYDLSQLHILLADERVNVKQADLNEQQLKDAGVWQAFADRGAKNHLLSKFDQADVVDRTKAIATDYKKVLDDVYQAVLLAGMGDDGHTAGMLPTKQANKFEKLFDIKQPVSYYQVDPNDSANPFTQRLTINLTAIKHISKVYLYCVGENKLPKIHELQRQAKSINQVPALSLFASAQPVTILTDQQL